MRWIDFENKTPVDTDIQGWDGWSMERWKKWLDKSSQLNQEMKKLNAKNRIEERNELIDNNRDHWSELMPWLSAISFGKCWFTEARDVASHMDIEHFRPKKIAKDLNGTERDGYWWLAFDYKNYRFAGNVPNRKKGGWFPLHKESRCSCFDEPCEESEAHYLLDPTKLGDVSLLAFDEEGHTIPAPEITDSWELDRVKVSVKHLKLDEHDALPEARRDVWQKTSRTIRSFLNAKSKYKPGNIAAKAIMEEKARTIHEMTRPNAEFSSVSRFCVLFHGDPQLTRMVL